MLYPSLCYVGFQYSPRTQMRFNNNIQLLEAIHWSMAAPRPGGCASLAGEDVIRPHVKNKKLYSAARPKSVRYTTPRSLKTLHNLRWTWHTHPKKRKHAVQASGVSLGKRGLSPCCRGTVFLRPLDRPIIAFSSGISWLKEFA